MPERILLVDLENVQTIDLSRVPPNARVKIFYGTTQKKFPARLVVQAQLLGPRLKWIEISGQGPNALDFHIAFYLGQELTGNPDCECTILSRDTGFDPLISHLVALGRKCRRASSLQEAFLAEEHLETDHFARLVTLLRKEKTRPARRKGLAGKVKGWFLHLSESERLALVQRLLDESLVRESENVLTYHL
ncbi:MAG TPA: PIN domain-containing protein [Steroidobacteraceae bacterium]|nr:PIN domain-containing protein [Steroidobacteraceae bacterium]